MKKLLTLFVLLVTTALYAKEPIISPQQALQIQKLIDTRPSWVPKEVMLKLASDTTNYVKQCFRNRSTIKLYPIPEVSTETKETRISIDENGQWKYTDSSRGSESKKYTEYLIATICIGIIIGLLFKNLFQNSMQKMLPKMLGVIITTSIVACGAIALLETFLNIRDGVTYLNWTDNLLLYYTILLSIAIALATSFIAGSVQKWVLN